MKKTLTIFFAALLAAFTLKADFVAWYVDDVAAEAYEFSYAKLMSGVDVSGAVPQGTALSGAISYDATANTQYTDLAGAAGSQYAIFLYDGSDNLMAYSEVLSADSIGQFSYASAPSGVLAPEVASVWSGGTFTAVPEPTMALLLGIGLSAFVLRRRVRA